MLTTSSLILIVAIISTPIQNYNCAELYRLQGIRDAAQQAVIDHDYQGKYDESERAFYICLGAAQQSGDVATATRECEQDRQDRDSENEYEYNRLVSESSIAGLDYQSYLSGILSQGTNCYP